MSKLSKSNSKANTLMESNKISLESKLNAIALTEEEIDSIRKKKTVDTIKDKILGSFKVGEIIQTVLNWNDNVNQEIQKEKEKILFGNLINKVDEGELKLNRIAEFLSNPYGFTLVNKIFRIMHDSPPDKELVNHLSNTLRNIINSNFELLFNKHRLFLNIIENLSPQSLTMFLDNENWPEIPPPGKGSGGRKTSMRRITTPWTKDFAIAYIKAKNLDSSNADLVNMVDYATFTLKSNNLIDSKSVPKDGGPKVIITELGESLLEYLV